MSSYHYLQDLGANFANLEKQSITTERITEESETSSGINNANTSTLSITETFFSLFHELIENERVSENYAKLLLVCSLIQNQLNLFTMTFTKLPHLGVKGTSLYYFIKVIAQAVNPIEAITALGCEEMKPFLYFVLVACVYAHLSSLLHWAVQVVSS